MYPNRKKETPQKIKEILRVFSDAGLLFLWQEGGRDWGYFVSFESHHSYCNKTSVTSDGKQERHKRKTPEPPKKELLDYLERSRASQSGLERTRTFKDKYRNPNPKPKKNPERSARPVPEITDTVKAERLWVEKYKSKYSAEPNMSPAKDRTILKQLISQHGMDEVMRRIPIHIEKGQLLSIGGFQTKFNDLTVSRMKSSKELSI